MTAMGLGATATVAVSVLFGLWMVLRYLRDAAVNQTREEGLKRAFDAAFESQRRKLEALGEAVTGTQEKLTQLSNRRQ